MTFRVFETCFSSSFVGDTGLVVAFGDTIKRVLATDLQCASHFRVHAPSLAMYNIDSRVCTVRFQGILSEHLSILLLACRDNLQPTGIPGVRQSILGGVPFDDGDWMHRIYRVHLFSRIHMDLYAISRSSFIISDAGRNLQSRCHGSPPRRSVLSQRRCTRHRS